MTKATPPKQRKIAIMGFRSVGKSSLTIQFVEGKFVDSYDPTIENTFTKMMRHQSQDYLIKLIDTAGQDEYSIVPSTYSMDVHGYVLVYSITSTKSLKVCKLIYEKLMDMTGQANLRIVLVGNKTDLHMERTVPYEEGKAVADSWNAAFMETSAKQNQTLTTSGTEGSCKFNGVKSVSEIFEAALTQVEKSGGMDLSKCSVS